jgi:hydroxymethylglutaryl-CoA lyase
VTRSWPRVAIVDETMREGMQIESADIPIDDKVRLLDALSLTGLQTIVVGSFVSPKWVPQMTEIDKLLEKFEPRPGVTYTALALNQRGVQRRAEFSPPLTLPSGRERHITRVHLCDVFVQRNTNRTRDNEISAWPQIVERAVAESATEASIGLNAAWGSNWVGEFSLDERMELLGRQYELWREAGIKVTRLWLGDPMSWNVPPTVAEQVEAAVRTWPDIDTVHLHLHNARGLAMTSAYAAMEVLSADRQLVLDSAVGGLGGCPYCGNGRATAMIPTEDLVHLLESLGLATGVDLDRLIEVGALAEEIVGRRLESHVTHAGPRPGPDQLYPMDLPLIETLDDAQHFRPGRPMPEGRRPWPAPIESFQRPTPSATDSNPSATRAQSTP